MPEVLVEFSNAMDALKHLRLGDPVVVMRRNKSGKMVPFRTYVEGTALVQDNPMRKARGWKLVLAVRVKGVVLPVKHNSVKKVVNI